MNPTVSVGVRGLDLSSADLFSSPPPLISERSVFVRPYAMDLRLLFKLHLLISASFLCLQARGDGSPTAVFLDSSDRRYLRTHPSGIAGETKSMLVSEVAATISVLLGFAPPASLTAESSAKLNEVLLPNPFDRPRAVIMLEVKGADYDLLPISYPSAQMGSILNTKVRGSSKIEIQLPDEDKVSVVFIDEPVHCDAACVDKELTELAHWLGGSYVGAVESADGELSFPLASGSSLRLHVSEKADLGFALGLVSLVRGIKKAVEMHEDFARSIQSPSELIRGCFTGIEALSEYGPDVAQQGVELLQTTLVKLFDLLQKSYQGKIVGVILFSKGSTYELGSMLDVKFFPRVSRLLEEVGSANTTIEEVILVRLTLAWITGIILLVSTLIGILMLLNMPLTRDTLLYSNVKLD